jgi:hypothetical protein
MNVAEEQKETPHMTTPELEAIRCGAVSAEKTCAGRATYRPQLGGLLCDGTSDGRALHLTLGVDDDTGVVLEVEENTVGPPPGLALADNDGGHDLLPELRLSLLDGGHDHVTGTTSGQAVKARTDTLDGDDVQVAGTRVVAAVHDGAAVIPLACVPHTQILHDRVRSSREGRERSRAGWTYTGRPRVILSLLPEEPRLRAH